MKILFVSNLYPPIAIGGYEQVCYDVAQALKARGHSIHILTSRYRAQEAAVAGGSEKCVYRSLK
ncbi:MAG TPA: glycogen/starch synthase, partial [Chloroflexia bacterium]|nr:glycogen/starch synthase [Chloroflexia bacterium]